MNSVLFVRQWCPAVFYKTFCPFRVGRFIFISLLINNNNVFFDGCHPLVLICFLRICVFCNGFLPPIRSSIISYICSFVKIFQKYIVRPIPGGRSKMPFFTNIMSMNRLSEFYCFFRFTLHSTKFRSISTAKNTAIFTKGIT